MDLLQHLYINLLLLFSIPIVLSAILRRIAGKHAPPDWESEEAAVRRRQEEEQRRKADNDYWFMMNNDLI
jgi:hypothetical protein